MSKHSHDGAHHHEHGEVTYDRAFIIAITANGLFVVMQIIFAYLT